MAVLTLNAGSSSLKFALFHDDRAILRGEVEDIDHTPKTTAKDEEGRALDPPNATQPGHEAILPVLFDWVLHHTASLDAVGHRVVHGGDRFDGPARVDDDSLAAMTALAEYAPLHQGHNVAAIRAVQAVRPDLPQVACFDTAFHRTMPDLARTLALPPRLGLRRHGFHGLSYEYVAGKLPPNLAAGRVIVAHLGSGASLCALEAGRSIETTMSTTALDGLVMGTRCGSIDPGALLLLLRRGMTPEQLEHLLYNESGLLGLSGFSADMRRLHEAVSAPAKTAIDLFVYRIATEAAAMAAALGGLDGFVFTAGIGENDPVIRQAVITRLSWLGFTQAPDAPPKGKISSPDAHVEIWVIPTDEEAVIARQTRQIIAST